MSDRLPGPTSGPNLRAEAVASRRVDPSAALDRRYTPRAPEQTLLHRVVREQLETFLARSRSEDQATPRFVEQELRAYLSCGVLAHGFLRLHCDDCGAALLQRVFEIDALCCPRCGSRLRLIAAIENPTVARKILECMKLLARAPPSR